MVWLLRILGGLGVFVGAHASYWKVFGSDAEVARYAGSTRNLDTPILTIAFGIVFFALSSILTRLRKKNGKEDT